jgi:hypothetical protein
MLVASRLVFVHIPRTGGAFVKTMLRQHLGSDPGAPKLPTHASFGELPRAFRDRPGFCIVRNPWDWYVSWFHHSLERGPALARLHPGAPKRVTWEVLFAGGQSTFTETVTKMCEGTAGHPFAESARRRDVDLYSEYVRILAGDAMKRRKVEPGRFEELVPFLLDFLDRNLLLTDPLREAITCTPPINASRHRPYRDYYDQQLRELVGHKARWLTRRFGYSF